MIGVEGQYYFKFELDGEKEFIPEDRFDSFSMFEEVGNILPTFRLQFSTADEKILVKFNEGSFFNVSFGLSKKDAPTIASFVVLKASYGRDGAGFRTVDALGSTTAIPYTCNSERRIIPSTSGIQAMEEIAQEHFNLVDKEPEQSDDKMNWIACGQSPRNFITNTWLHTRLENSTPIIALTVDGKFKIRSLKKIGEESAKWGFSIDGKGGPGTPVVITGNQGVIHQAGFMNAFAGYERKMVQVEMDKKATRSDDAEVEDENGYVLRPNEIMGTATSQLGKVSPLMRAQVVGRRWEDLGFLSENVDRNFWQTYQNNISTLAIHSTLKAKVLTVGLAHPIELLDGVMFYDPSIESQSSLKSTSGKYIITKIVRTVTVKDFRIIVEMCREGIAGSDGKLR